MLFLKKILLIFVAALLAIVVQGSILKAISPHMVVPNLFLVLVVYLGFYETNAMGVFLAFVVGLMSDLSSGVLLGPHAASAVVIFFILSLLSQTIFVESWVTSMLSVFFGALVAQFVYFTLVYEFKPVDFSLIGFSVFEAFLSAIVAPFVFRIFNRFYTKNRKVGFQT